MKQVLVSILVPVYKVPEDYLRKCIESLISQSLKDIEIILVDDGSPDNCGAICDEYAEIDSRLKVIHKANGGLSAARNTAYDASCGKSIMFVDGDDYLSTDACEKAYNAMNQNNVELVCFNYIMEYKNSQKFVKAFDDQPIKFDENGCKELQVKIFDYNGRVSQAFAKLIRREYLEKYDVRHVDELRQGAEGFVFNIALLEKLHTAYYMPEPLYHYRYNDSSISHSHSEENDYLIIRCFEYIENYISHSTNKNELEKNMYTRLLYVVVTTGVSGYFNSKNKQPYIEKVHRYRKFLNEPLIRKALQEGQYEKLPKIHRLVLVAVKLRLFRVVSIVGFVRGKQRQLK